MYLDLGLQALLAFRRQRSSRLDVRLLSRDQVDLDDPDTLAVLILERLEHCRTWVKIRGKYPGLVSQFGGNSKATGSPWVLRPAD